MTGQHYADGYTDTVSVQRFIAPAVVIDCTKEAAADEKFLLEPAISKHGKRKHGRIPDGAWVLMRTDWSKREDPARFLNMKEDGPHVPGPSAAAVKFLVTSATSMAGAWKRSAPMPVRLSHSSRLSPRIT